MAEKHRKKKGAGQASSQGVVDGFTSAAGTVCAEDLYSEFILSQFASAGNSMSHFGEAGRETTRSQFTNSLGAEEDGDLVAYLKKLNKKDSTTRMKGLVELLALTKDDTRQKCWTPSALMSFVQSYHSRLAISEEDWRVRDHAHQVIRLLCGVKHLKKSLRSHFSILWPTWLIALYHSIFQRNNFSVFEINSMLRNSIRFVLSRQDPHAEVARSAGMILPKTKDLHLAQLAEFRRDIVGCFVRLLNEDMPTTHDAAYERVTSCVLSAIRDLAHRISQVVCSTEDDDSVSVDVAPWIQLLGSLIWDDFSVEQPISGQRNLIYLLAPKYPAKVRWACMGALISLYKAEKLWMHNAQSLNVLSKEVVMIANVLKEKEALCTERALHLFCVYVDRTCWKSESEPWTRGSVSLQHGIWNPILAMVRSAGYSQTGEIFQPYSPLGGGVLLAYVLDKLQFYLKPSRAIILMHAVAMAVANHPSLSAQHAFEFYSEVGFTALRNINKNSDSGNNCSDIEVRTANDNDLVDAIFWPIRFLVVADGVQLLPFPGHEKIRAVARQRVGCILDMIPSWVNRSQSLTDSSHVENSLRHILAESISELLVTDLDNIHFKSLCPLLLVLRQLQTDISMPILTDLFQFVLNGAWQVERLEQSDTLVPVSIKLLRQLPMTTASKEYANRIMKLQHQLHKNKIYATANTRLTIRNIISHSAQYFLCCGVRFDLHFAAMESFFHEQLRASCIVSLGKDRCDLFAIQCLRSMSELCSGVDSESNKEGIESFWHQMLWRIVCMMWPSPIPDCANDMVSTDFELAVNSILVSLCRVAEAAYVQPPKAPGQAKNRNPKGLRQFPVLPAEHELVSRGRASFHMFLNDTMYHHAKPDKTMQLLIVLALAAVEKQKKCPQVSLAPPWIEAVQTILRNRLAPFPFAFHVNLCTDMLDLVFNMPYLVHQIAWTELYVLRVDDYADQQKPLIKRTCEVLCRSALTGVKGAVPILASFLDSIKMTAEFRSSICLTLLKSSLLAHPQNETEQSIPWSRVAYVLSKYIDDDVASIVQHSLPSWPPFPGDFSSGNLLRAVTDFISLVARERYPYQAKIAWPSVDDEEEIRRVQSAREKCWVDVLLGDDCRSQSQPNTIAQAGLLLAFDLETLDQAHYRLVSNHLRHSLLSLDDDVWPLWAAPELLKLAIKYPLRHLNLSNAVQLTTSDHMHQAPLHVVCFHSLSAIHHISTRILGSGTEGVKSLRRTAEDLGDKLLKNSDLLNEVEGVVKSFIYEVIINVLPETPEIQRLYRTELPRWNKYFTVGALIVRSALEIRTLPESHRSWFLPNSQHQSSSCSSMDPSILCDDNTVASADKAIHAALDSGCWDHLNAASRYAAVVYHRAFRGNAIDFPESVQSLLSLCVPPQIGVVIPRSHLHASNISHDRLHATSGENDDCIQELHLRTVLPGVVDLIAIGLQSYSESSGDACLWASNSFSVVLDSIKRMTAIEGQAGCLRRGLADPLAQSYREKLGCSVIGALGRLPLHYRQPCERVLVSQLHPRVPLVLLHRMAQRMSSSKLENALLGIVPDEYVSQICQQIRDHCLDRVINLKPLKKLDDQQELDMDSDSESSCSPDGTNGHTDAFEEADELLDADDADAKAMGIIRSLCTVTSSHAFGKDIAEFIMATPELLHDFLHLGEHDEDGHSDTLSPRSVMSSPRASASHQSWMSAAGQARRVEFRRRLCTTLVSWQHVLSIFFELSKEEGIKTGKVGQESKDPSEDEQDVCKPADVPFERTSSLLQAISALIVAKPFSGASDNLKPLLDALLRNLQNDVDKPDLTSPKVSIAESLVLILFLLLHEPPDAPVSGGTNYFELVNRLATEDTDRNGALVDFLQKSSVDVWQPECANFVYVLALRVYCMVLRVFPGVVSKVWGDGMISSRPMRDAVEKLTSRLFSVMIMSLEAKTVVDLFEKEEESGSKNMELADREVNVTFSRNTRSITTKYSRGELAGEMTLHFPANYPLHPAQITVGEVLVASKERQRHWQLGAQRALKAFDPPFLVIKAWTHNLDLVAVDDIEDCPICYSVVHIKSGAIPKKACAVCKYKFHTECIFRWFRTSQKATCPLCQNPWAM